jgi:hypothetical protein
LLLCCWWCRRQEHLTKTKPLLQQTAQASKAKRSKAPARMICITLLYKNWQRSHQISTEQELWATPENSSLNSIVCQMPQLFSLLLFSSWEGEGV